MRQRDSDEREPDLDAPGNSDLPNSNILRYISGSETDLTAEKLITKEKYKPWKCESLSVPVQGILHGWACLKKDASIPRWRILINELLVGLIILSAQIPESIAFALMGGFEPAFGMHGAMLVGLFSTIFGGRGGVVCGITGSVSSLTVAVITYETKRPSLLFPIVITAGVYMLIFSFLRLSRVVRFISKSVMIGFCNGLAIIIGVSQLHMFYDPDGNFVTGEIALHMAIMTILSSLTFELWGKVPVVGKFPAALMAIGIGIAYDRAIVVAWRGLKTSSVGDLAAFQEDNRFPTPFWMLPSRLGYDFNFDASDVLLIMKYGVTFALIALLESLMTINVLDSIYGDSSESDQFMFSIGLGNVMSGLFGGMGGNTMLGLSNLLYRCGGTGKEPGVLAGIGIFLTTAFVGDFLNFLPTASLAGIMFIIVFHTFSLDSVYMVLCTILPTSWRSKKHFLHRKIPKVDALVLVLVSALIPTMGMDVGVLLGIFITAINFAQQMFRNCQVFRSVENTNLTRYDIYGPVFFASSLGIDSVFVPEEDSAVVHVRMHNSLIMDYSAMETLSSIRQRYEDLGKEFHVLHMTAECENRLEKAKATVKWNNKDMYEVELPHLEAFCNEVPNFPH